MKSSKHGLTLVELVVVLGITMLAVTLLLPIRSHDGVSPSAVCRYHLKQIGLSATMLAMDNNERFPTNLTRWNSPQFLKKFISSNEFIKVISCPQDKGSIFWPTNCTSVSKTVGTSYAFAWTDLPHAGVCGLFESNRPLKLAYLAIDWSKKIIFFEPTLNEENPISDLRTQWHSPRRASNAAFLDGHAEFLTTNYTTLPDASSVSNRYYY